MKRWGFGWQEICRFECIFFLMFGLPRYFYAVQFMVKIPNSLLIDIDNKKLLSLKQGRMICLYYDGTIFMYLFGGF